MHVVRVLLVCMPASRGMGELVSGLHSGLLGVALIQQALGLEVKEECLKRELTHSQTHTKKLANFTTVNKNVFSIFLRSTELYNSSSNELSMS